MSTTTSAPKRCAIYCRISSDREGEALGVARQEEDCRALAERHGYEIARVYVDNDRGASSRSRKKRPEYAAMLSDAAEGKFTAILAYSNSRLTRRPREFEGLIDLYDRHGVVLRTVVSGDDNLGTADGRMVARIKASVDAAEAERIAERVSRAALQSAQSGKWRGGARPFGFEADGVTIRPEEAEAVREAYRTVLAGGSVRSVLRDWNATGLTTGKGGKSWTQGGVRDLLRSPRYAGLRGHNGEIMGFAEWPAIVDETVWRSVAAILNDPGRKHGKKSARRLLTGVARCGVCGATVHSSGSNAERPLYRCSESQGHVARSGKPVDEYVSALVLARLSRGDIAALVAEDGEDNDALDFARQQTTALRARLDALAVEFADGKIDSAQLRAGSARFRELIAGHEKVLAERTTDNVLTPLIEAQDITALWESFDNDRKRAVIDVLMEVIVHPTGRGTRVFKPETVEIHWKQ